MTQHDDPYANYGATPSSPVALESVRITLALYRTGKSGIQYDKLQQFIQPILAHYQIELETGVSDEVTPENIEDMTLLLDIFETATILWDYCCLASDDKTGAFSELKINLLGPDPSREDLVQFPVLVASMEEKWEHLSEGEPATASYATASDPAQLHTDASPFSENGAAHYGSENLDIPEAFALFSRPLLDNDAIYEDPESLDDVMTKAQAYWDLAHLPPAALEKQLIAVISNFTTSTVSKEHVKREALEMIERFHELFPERK
ncbi:MAG: hypothetical protein AB8G77_04645 [Rhodothermales bacterium]